MIRAAAFNHMGDGADYVGLMRPFGTNADTLNDRRAAETVAAMTPEERARAKKGRPIMKQLNLRIPESAFLLAKDVAAEMGVSQPVMIVAAIKALNRTNKRKQKKEGE